MHISDFTASVGNPAKPFKWDVIIPALPISTGIRAQSTQWPSIGSTIIDLFHMGQIAKYPGAPEYEHTWPTNIVESETGDIFNAVWQWRQLVFDQVTGLQANVDVFKRDITLHCKTDNDTIWAICVLRNAFPLTVEAVDLDKSANTEAYRWNVIWSFDWWDRG